MIKRLWCKIWGHKKVLRHLRVNGGRYYFPPIKICARCGKWDPSEIKLIETKDLDPEISEMLDKTLWGSLT